MHSRASGRRGRVRTQAGVTSRICSSLAEAELPPFAASIHENIGSRVESVAVKLRLGAVPKIRGMVEAEMLQIEIGTRPTASALRGSRLLWRDA
jgi:hypothetical protein